jgi:uncharacterized membrane protein YebE (DUF533 family)
MFIYLFAVAVLGGAGYFAYKHYGSSKVVSAVKAEVSKIESEAVAEEAAIKAKVLAVVARVKSLL